MLFQKTFSYKDDVVLGWYNCILLQFLKYVGNFLIILCKFDTKTSIFLHIFGVFNNFFPWVWSEFKTFLYHEKCKSKNGRNLALSIVYAILHHYHGLTPLTSNYKKWPKLYFPLSLKIFWHSKMVSSKHVSRLDSGHKTLCKLYLRKVTRFFTS